ncbi:G patch domain and ankyrin repeat-containing protein 1 homolog isoform X1 [Ornithodoros turicata]|uniref:G patch domain and ankyrin repeat-containing protein 1 homolog isoform X1 n=1 Tax=Ornithodoros turicata TaxID=34597 RepID=UPI003139D776
MSYFRTIRFIRESRNSECTAFGTREWQCVKQQAENLSGEEAKRFYDDLISTPSASVTTAPSKKARRVASSIPKPSKLIKRQAKSCELLYAAEMNNVDDIQKCLSSGLDVNVADDFGWTALMCSSCSGAEDAVRFLLNENADDHIKNKQNKTAIDLARERGHMNIVRLLCKSENISSNQAPELTSEPTRDEFCSVCERLVTSTELSSHNTSILHQLSLEEGKLSTTHYGIPDSNTGFQMLLQMGWNRERGFGPSESGRKYPVKTVLKRDRAGLGKEISEARVTHFEPHDCSAIENARRKKTPTATTSKKGKRKGIDISRMKEIEFRREFY